MYGLFEVSCDSDTLCEEIIGVAQSIEALEQETDTMLPVLLGIVPQDTSSVLKKYYLIKDVEVFT